MKLRLLYFGIVRERLGKREESRECSDGTTVGDLLAALAGSDGILALGAGSLRIAVNREYVHDAHVLHDNDEVAVIPPVAGGLQPYGARAATRPPSLASGRRVMPWDASPTNPSGRSDRRPG